MTSSKTKISTAPPFTSTAIQFWSATPSLHHNQCPWLNSPNGLSHSENDVSKYSLLASTLRSIDLYMAFFFAKVQNVKYYKTHRKANIRWVSVKRTLVQTLAEWMQRLTFSTHMMSSTREKIGVSCITYFSSIVTLVFALATALNKFRFHSP